MFWTIDNSSRQIDRAEACCLCPFFLLDLPFSLILDTLALPYDYYKATQSGRTRTGHPADIVRMYGVSSPWWLTIRQNGSGRLGYGSSGTVSGKFTNKTFDVASLASELTIGSTTNQPTVDSFYVRVGRPDGDTIASFWTTNIVFVTALLSRANDGLEDSSMNAGVKSMWDKARPSN